MASEESLPTGVRAHVRSESTTSYQVRIRLKGHPMQVATFSPLTDAKHWSKETLGR